MVASQSSVGSSGVQYVPLLGDLRNRPQGVYPPGLRSRATQLSRSLFYSVINAEIQFLISFLISFFYAKMRTPPRQPFDEHSGGPK